MVGLILALWTLVEVYYHLKCRKKPTDVREPKEEKQSFRPLTEDEIWQHPIVLAAGLEKPIPTAEVEEYEGEKPLAWRVITNERGDNYITIIDEIENEKLERCQNT